MSASDSIALLDGIRGVSELIGSMGVASLELLIERELRVGDDNGERLAELTISFGSARRAFSDSLRVLAL